MDVSLSGSATVLKNKIKALRDEIVELRKQKRPSAEDWESSRKEKRFGEVQLLKPRGTLLYKDTGRVSGFGFGKGAKCLTLCGGSKAPCGSVIEWDCNAKKELNTYILTDQWQLCFEFEREYNNFFATGDLNNDVNVYNINDMQKNSEDMVGPAFQMKGHIATVEAVTFVEPEQIISASGDKTLRLWNVERQQCINTFLGHTSNVSCVARHPDTSSPIFVSGGSDFTARLWDIREVSTGQDHRAQASLTFDTHSRDVNDVAYFPDGNVFAAALNNSETHLYDTRASCKLLTFRHQSTHFKCQAEQVKLSASGRLMFVLYKDGTFIVYDVAGPVISDGRGVVYNENKVKIKLPDHPVRTIAISPSEGIFGASVDHPATVHTAVDLYRPGKGRR